MNRVTTVAAIIGLCHMRVCAAKDVPEDEVIAYCNRDNPAGTTNGWIHIERDGKLAPVECAEDPSRVHYMVVC